MSDNLKQEILALLTEARQELLDTLNSLTPEQWETIVFPGDDDAAWTVTDLLRHLSDSERGLTGQAQAWQAGKNPIPPDFDLARWNKRAVQKRKDKSAEELLSDLAESRKALLAFIDTLQPDDWQKKGRHASLRILTIEQIIKLIGHHERDHARNIREAVQKSNA